ncbi:hypothetical protein SSS_04595 [Sarcoptes scabiei]|nr:hypothetical protein SSS_04595 [Sarcoptes scabiei]
MNVHDSKHPIKMPETIDNLIVFGKYLCYTVAPWILYKMISSFHLRHKERKCGFLTFVTGSYLAPQNCKVLFDWKSPTTVSNLASFTIKLMIGYLYISLMDRKSCHVQSSSVI